MSHNFEIIPIITEQVIVSRQLVGTLTNEIGRKLSIWNDYQAFLGNIEQFINNNGYHRVVGELIQVHHELGGNGLNYGEGVSYTYYDNGVVRTATTRLSESILNNYFENGSATTNPNYSGHHINAQASFDNLKYEPNNIVIITNATHNTYQPNPKDVPLAQMNYTAQIWGQYLLALEWLMLQQVVISFAFGALFGCITAIIRSLVGSSNKVTIKNAFALAKADAKGIFKSGLISGIVATVINTVFLIFIIALSDLLHLSFNSLSAQLTSIMIPFAGIIIYHLIKDRNNPKTFKEKIIHLLPMLAIFLVLSLPSILLSTVARWLGFIINIAVVTILEIATKNESINNKTPLKI